MNSASTSPTRRPTLARRIARTLLLLVMLLVVLGAAAVGAAAWRESGSRTVLAPSTGRFVQAGDVELFIQEAGPAAGDVVVLIHGTGAWSEIWRTTMERLAAGGFRAVAVDMPPFGFSERPASADYTTAVQGERIVALLQALDARRVTLVGHSFGARATVEAAMRAPDRLRGLVLVDAALGLHDASGATLAEPDDTGPGIVSAVLGVGPVRRPLVAGALTNPMMTRTLLRQLISRKDSATTARVTMLQRPLALSGSTTALGRWLQWFVRPDRPPLSGSAASYSSIAVPTLVVWGAADSLTPLPQGLAISRLLPNSRLQVLDGTGHIPAIEDPAAFNEALLGFLRGNR